MAAFLLSWRAWRKSCHHWWHTCLLACLLGLCRVVFEQCCSCWERLNTRAMALLPSATGQGTAEGRKKKKKQELQLDSQGQPDWDEEQVSQTTAFPVCSASCAWLASYLSTTGCPTSACC